MSRSFAELLPTPLTAESLAQLQPLSRAADLLLLLERWVERGWLRALDKAFVAFCMSATRRAIRWCCWQRH